MAAPIDIEFLASLADVTGPPETLKRLRDLAFGAVAQADLRRRRDALIREAADLVPGTRTARACMVANEMLDQVEGDRPEPDDRFAATVAKALRFCRDPLSARQIARILLGGDVE